LYFFIGIPASLQSEFSLTLAGPKTPGQVTAVRTTVEKWREDYLALAMKNNLASETLRKYRHLFSQLDTFAKNKGIRFVDEFDLETTTDFRLSWTDGALSTSKKLERLRGILKFAKERKWIAENPALSLKAPQTEDNPTLPFSDKEMTAIIKAARTPADSPKPKLAAVAAQRVYTFILAMRSTGLRISDVTKLAVSSLSGNRLSLRQAKTGEPVSILLDDTVADALRAVIPLNRNKDYFFWTGESTLPAATSLWRKKIADVFTRAKITNGHTHRFRDTFSVALLEKGNSIETVSQLLGHQDIKITQKHYNPWVKKRQEALDAAVADASGWLHELEQPEEANVVPMRRKK
jgi:integrase/recombinase XerD